MSARISALHFDAKAVQVWKLLTQVGTIGRYEEVVRTLIMGWVNNVWRYDAEGRPGELDNQILMQVEHLRLGEANRGPCVHPFVNCLDGLLYGVHLTTYEPGLEVRVTGMADMPGPVLSIVFAPSFEERRTAGYAKLFGIDLPDLTAPGLTDYSAEAISRDSNIGRVEINIVA